MRTSLSSAVGFPVALAVLFSTVLPLAGATAEGSSPWRFEGSMPRAVLERYLARSITYSGLLHGIGNPDDNVRMLVDCGAKLVGRAIYRWGGEKDLEAVLATARQIARKVHERDPEIILQAAIFEIVTTQVDSIPIPAWVFEAFGRVPEDRRFRYEAMLDPDRHQVDHWARGASVPDVSREETRMWFFYVAARYFEVGVEAIHFGQVEIMDDRDPDHAAWRDLLRRIRRLASSRCRRQFVLCDAHVPSGGIVHGGKLLFDLHSFPLRIEEVGETPGDGVLKKGYLDSIFGRSAGGMTPSGWACDALPYMVELDNFEPSGRAGQNIGGHWIWGYDEISWLAHQRREYRDRWLRYAWAWIRQTDPAGYLQMPGSRRIQPPVEGRRWYFANRASDACPGGFGDEDTIREIWKAEAARPTSPPAGAGE